MEPLEIETEDGHRFLARNVDGFVDTDWLDVCGWVEEKDNTAPDCWSDGICWTSNANGEPSDPPVKWRWPTQEQDDE